MTLFEGWKWGEWFFFLLANAIVIGICLPPLIKDIRRWSA